MDLLREARTRVAGGTAVAVLIPLAIVVASLGLGGGFGGLGALTQAFEGPELPGVEPVAARVPDPGEDPGELIAAAAPVPTAAPAATTAPTPGAGTPLTRAVPPAVDGGGGGDDGEGDGSGGGAQPPAGTPAPASPAPAATPAPQPTPAPGEPPSTIRQVGDEVKEVTDQVPVAGEPAGEVVDTIVDTVDALPLPLP